MTENSVQRFSAAAIVLPRGGRGKRVSRRGRPKGTRRRPAGQEGRPPSTPPAARHDRAESRRLRSVVRRWCNTCFEPDKYSFRMEPSRSHLNHCWLEEHTRVWMVAHNESTSIKPVHLGWRSAPAGSRRSSVATVSHVGIPFAVWQSRPRPHEGHLGGEVCSRSAVTLEHHRLKSSIGRRHALLFLVSAKAETATSQRDTADEEEGSELHAPARTMKELDHIGHVRRPFRSALDSACGASRPSRAPSGSGVHLFVLLIVLLATGFERHHTASSHE
jgi:hypothetical protein